MQPPPSNPPPNQGAAHNTPPPVAPPSHPHGYQPSYPPPPGYNPPPGYAPQKAQGLSGGAIVGIIVVALVAVCGIGSIAATAANGKPDNVPIAEGPTNASPAVSPTHEHERAPAKPDLEVLEAKSATGRFGNRTIVGRVRNNTDHAYGYAQVEINLKDDSGDVVGSTLANINNLEPGATWKFEAAILDEKATKFEIKDVTGF